MTRDILGNYSADFSESPVVGGVTPESQQQLRIFLPDPVLHPKPVNGYPIFIFTSSGGFVVAPSGTVIPNTSPFPILPWSLLEDHGIAIGWLGVTGSYASVGGPLNTTSPGRGLFHPPGTAGWEDDTRYSSPKEAILGVQLTRFRAEAWSLDADRICLDGQSSGSVTMAAPAFWEDQRDPGKNDHRSQSSRVRAVRLRQNQSDWRVYDTATTIPTNFSVWPNKLGDITTDIATRFQDIPDGYLRWASPLEVGLDSAIARDRNKGLYIWMHSFDAGLNMTDFSLSGTFGEFTGKVPTAAGTVDANAVGALHELGQSLMFQRAMREIEVGFFQSRNSRNVLDAAAHANVVTVEPGLQDEIAYIREDGAIDSEILEPEIAWIAWVLQKPIMGREISYNADPSDVALTLKADLYDSTGTLVAGGLHMYHEGEGQYGADFPLDPVPDPGYYIARIKDGARQLGQQVVNFSGTIAISTGEVYENKVRERTVAPGTGSVTQKDSGGTTKLASTAFEDQPAAQFYRTAGVQRRDRMEGKNL